MKVTKGTIIRTILLSLTLINMWLRAMGKSPIVYDEANVTNLFEFVIEACIIVLTFWKNNSFTQSALRADAYLKAIREFDESADETDSPV